MELRRFGLLLPLSRVCRKEVSEGTEGPGGIDLRGYQLSPANSKEDLLKVLRLTLLQVNRSREYHVRRRVARDGGGSSCRCHYRSFDRSSCRRRTSHCHSSHRPRKNHCRNSCRLCTSRRRSNCRLCTSRRRSNYRCRSRHHRRSGHPFAGRGSPPSEWSCGRLRVRRRLVHSRRGTETRLQMHIVFSLDSPKLMKIWIMIRGIPTARFQQAVFRIRLRRKCGAISASRAGRFRPLGVVRDGRHSSVRYTGYRPFGSC